MSKKKKKKKVKKKIKDKNQRMGISKPDKPK